MRRATQVFLLASSLLAYGCGGSSGGGGGAGHGGKGGGGAAGTSAGTAGAGGIGGAGAGGTSAGGTGGAAAGAGGTDDAAAGAGGTNDAAAGAGGTNDAAAGAGGTSDGGMDSASDSGGATDGAPADAVAACGTSTAVGGGATCSSFQPAGPCVVESVSTGAPPAPAGGSVVAGTYELVARTIYAAPDAGTDAGLVASSTAFRQTIIVTGSGSAFTVQMATASGSTTERQNGTVTTTGTTTLTFTPTCPVVDGGSGAPSTVPYTTATSASGTGLVIFSDLDDGDTIRIDVYTKL